MTELLVVAGEGKTLQSRFHALFPVDFSDEVFVSLDGSLDDKTLIPLQRVAPNSLHLVTEPVPIHTGINKTYRFAFRSWLKKTISSLIPLSEDTRTEEMTRDIDPACAHQFGFTVHGPKLEVDFEPAVYLTTYFLYLLGEAAAQEELGALDVLTHFMDMFIGEFTAMPSSSKLLYRLEENINTGLTAAQRLLIVSFFGYLDPELPPSFPTGPLLQCFKNLPSSLPSFTKQHLKKSFRTLFIHNIQNSARAEWREYLELMATRDKQFAFLKHVTSSLPQVGKGVLLGAWTNEALSSTQRNALVSHLIPYNYGDLEDVVDIFLDADDIYVQLICRQRISRSLHTTSFSKWEHLLQKIGKPVKRAQLEEEAQNIKKAILSKFGFASKKTTKEEAPPKGKAELAKAPAKTVKITKAKAATDEKPAEKEKETTGKKTTTKTTPKETKGKDTTETPSKAADAKEPAKVKVSKPKGTASEPAQNEASTTTTKTTTKKATVKVTKTKAKTADKEVKDEKDAKPTKSAKELTDAKVVDTKAPKETKVTNGSKTQAEPEKPNEEEQEAIDKEEELNTKRVAMVDTFRDALLQYVAKGTKVPVDQEPNFCNVLVEYELLENEQFEEPLRYLLEIRRPSLLVAFVTTLGRANMQDAMVVTELSKEWFYINLEQTLTPLLIYQLLLSILPAIAKYQQVYEHLERIASEKLESTGPKSAVQYARDISKLGGEHAEIVQKSYVQAAEPLIAKGVLSMANIRDMVLAVGPEGVQDLITATLLVKVLDSMGTFNIDNPSRPPVICVIDSSDAWYSILSLQGPRSAAIQQHTLAQQAIHHIKTAAESLEAIDATSITLVLLSQILALDQQEVMKYFKLMGREDAFYLLQQSAEKLELYNAQVMHLNVFYQQFCRLAKATDLAKHEEDFEKKRKDTNILLRMILTDTHWGIHKPFLALAKKMAVFAGSSTFANVFRRTCTSYGKPVDVQGVGTLADMAMEAFKKFCQTYIIIYNSVTTIANVEPMWENVSPDVVDEELAIISKYMDAPIPPEVPSLIQIYTQLPTTVLKAQHITQMLEILFLQEDPTYLSFLEYPKFKEQKDLTLAKLEVSTNAIFVHVKDYVDADWAFVEALSRAKDLVTFLKQVLNEDLRNLIDAVETHSDQFIRESTVSDLIDVKSFFQGVLKKRLSGAEFLVLLHTGLTRDINLGAKVHVCNENLRGLERLYANVANRSEVTKEIIANALKLGVIEFTAESVVLTYTANVLATYTLPEMVELRSRALLIANLAKDTHFKNVAVHNQNQNPDDPQVKNDLEAAANVTAFVKLVDLAQGISDVLVQLKQLGHFLYQKQVSTVNLGLHDEGMAALQKLYDELQTKLKEWENILSRARRQHYRLTYLNASQLLLLRAFLDGALEEQMKPHLQNALAFLHPSGFDVNLDTVTPTGEQDLYARVCEVGDYLTKLFASAQPFFRPIKNKPASPLAPPVLSRELYVASVSNKVQIIPVLMSLFANTGNYPEPHQVLFCHAQTQWEQLNLLLMRCFFAHKNGLGDALYCIANIEFLDFGLQSQLATTIQALQAETNAPYYLALIVNRENSEQHILDKFAENVHSVDVPLEAVRPIIRSVFKYDTYVVTAELAGIGKSETISQMAYADKKRPVHFPISGPISRHALIARLNAVAMDSNTECLHMDIGIVDDTNMVNTFLFELLVVGSVSSGVLFCYGPKSSVFIEIANSSNNNLVNQLPICNHFFKLSLQWSPSKIIASRIVTSPIQVVCNYLLALETNTLSSKDLCFTPPAKRNVEALSSQQCAGLLDKYFFKDTPNLSFSILNIFLNFFSAQLIKFTQSQFFMVGNLIAMGAKGTLRAELVIAIMNVSVDFSHRSAGVVRKSQSTELQGTAEEAVSRLEGMIQWEQSNHLLVVFHSQDPHTISALYRDKSLVPKSIHDLLKSQSSTQHNWQLEDYSKMPHAELLQKLERIVRTTFDKHTYPAYALTSDNFLKMALIVLRIRARIPVVVMGETGCGKTSLVKFLSLVAEVDFKHMDFHSGITEQNIIDFVTEFQTLAIENPQKSFWMFLDEINTCDQLGLISELICHRSMLGVPLPLNLCLIAACNPYRLRTKQTQTSGLEGKIKWDDLSKLVYRVHPLPESLMDYVWDYGTLDVVDEKSYIATIVSTTFPKAKADVVALMVEAIYCSQHYIRSVESPESVSMRDVKRCKTLILWFSTHLKTSADSETEVQKKSIVLGLAHCYYCRLCTTEQRETYKEKITSVFRGGPIDLILGANTFENILHAEQMGYLSDMELPEGIAPNTALLENVFVVLVCILNKIPVFVVGKPGCSKSLSLQLINSNLRGLDSKSAFFQRLPQVFIIAYQGSESSTSDGILKVFAKAHKYVEHNKGVIPVVLLDEVGLAEISKYNPLKVLHGLLEPAYPKESLDVAVVGISNWALDSAKMNRAIHLSRPEPDVHDLCETGKAIQQMIAGRQAIINDARMLALASAYHKYISTQVHSNFHGLRDYYSLIKCLSQQSTQITYGVERNFGGLPSEMRKVLDIFLALSATSQYTPTPVIDLIRGNLADRTARHLMVISSGDSVIGILERALSQAAPSESNVPKAKNKKSKSKTKEQSVLHQAPFVIFGSKFPEDRSEEYRYRVLSKIILCMETGRTVILKDLEDIYGSLYDMLNQNYTYVGKKKNCRIALGAYSNPMCNVHEDFRCIVLVDVNNVDFTDPPFLNRFEKQMILYDDILDKPAHAVLTEVKNWAAQISHVGGFEEHDVFVGFTQDTLSSLALLYSSLPAITAVEKIKEELMWIATPDGILRAANAQFEFAKLREVYFTEQVHDSLHSFLQFASTSHLDPTKTKKWQDSLGMKVAVMTHSNIHTNVSNLIGPVFPRSTHQVFRLGTFTSEKQLTNTVRNFFADTNLEVLALQCDALVDAPHILLAKYIVDQLRSDYLEQIQTPPPPSPSTPSDPASPLLPISAPAPQPPKPRTKHLILVLHVPRANASAARWQLNYQSGWDQVTIDTLETTDLSISRLLSEPLLDLLRSDAFPLEKSVRDAFEKLAPYTIDGRSKKTSASSRSYSRVCRCRTPMVYKTRYQGVVYERSERQGEIVC
eukprot:Phypoly_transcript_00019.p1 GENE.Phypoly_transcript_00019~~Phypoly_transcript_00019.p1  ORF type:complete len:3090 (+),score=490.35 Phypoly_transcript_00019:142-9411(+)